MASKKPLSKDEYQNEVLRLLREILSGVQLSDIDFPEHLQGDERLDFLKYCSMVTSSPWFEKIFSALYWPHIVSAGLKAPNYDIVTFNRGTGNGIAFAQEFFEKYNNTYIKEFEKDKEEVDEHSAFQRVKG